MTPDQRPQWNRRVVPPVHTAAVRIRCVSIVCAPARRAHNASWSVAERDGGLGDVQPVESGHAVGAGRRGGSALAGAAVIVSPASTPLVTLALAVPCTRSRVKVNSLVAGVKSAVSQVSFPVPVTMACGHASALPCPVTVAADRFGLEPFGEVQNPMAAATRAARRLV